MLLFGDITERILGAAIAVHTELGPGLLESIYEECLAREMTARGIRFTRQTRLPVRYRGELVGGHYRVDFLVEDEVVVELKAIERLEAVHRAQLLSYLRLSGKQVGLLLNFNVPILPTGVVRMVNSRVSVPAPIP